jgi:hypothetical protein
MAVLAAFQYDGNEATFALAEGAWTDSDKHKEGGYFATPLTIGQEVELGSTEFLVQTCATTTDIPVGYLKSITGGKNAENGRYGTVKLYCDFIKEVEIQTASDAISVGESVEYFSAGGVYGKGLWQISSANDTKALQATAASGSIAAGTRIYVAFGCYNVA